MIVGAPDDSTDGAGAGLAHVFQRSLGVWNFDESLHDASPAVQSEFGKAVSVSGSWCGVGAPGDGNGTVNLFWRSAGSYDFTTEPGWAAGSDFGWALDLEEPDGVDATYVFAGAWGRNSNGSDSGAIRTCQVTPTTVFSGYTVAPFTLGPGDYFGADLAYDDGTLVVGAYGDDTLETNSGAAYVFEVDFLNPAPVFSLKQILTGCLSDDSDKFARSVDMDGDRIAVGARRVDAAGPQGGAAYAVSLSPEAYPGGLLESPRAATHGRGQRSTDRPWGGAGDHPRHFSENSGPPHLQLRYFGACIPQFGSGGQE